MIGKTYGLLDLLKMQVEIFLTDIENANKQCFILFKSNRKTKGEQNYG